MKKWLAVAVLTIVALTGAVAIGSAMFFGANGSIAGGQMYRSGRPGAAGAYSRMWKTAAS